MGCALAHPEQSPLHHLERIGLHVDQEKQQPILRGRQRTVLIGCVAAGGTRLPIEAPVGHMGLERGLKGRDQLPKLVHGETGRIQDLRRAALPLFIWVALGVGFGTLPGQLCFACEALFAILLF
jgi:hypothetical protein